MPAPSALLVLACLGLACGGENTDLGGSAAVATVELSLVADTLEAGVGTQLTATARDAEGTALTGRSVAWASDDQGVAIVDPSGQVTGVDNGTATIQATVEGVSAEAELTVYVGVTGSWEGTLLAGADNCPIIHQLAQELDGAIGGVGTASAPCEGSFVLAGQMDAGGVADSIYLYWNGSTTADVIQGGHFDGVHGIGSYLTGGGCGGQGCPVTLTRTSVEVPAELVP